MTKNKKSSNEHWLKTVGNFMLNFFIAPIIVGIIVWAITKHKDNETINGLEQSIKSLDRTIQTQQDSLKGKNATIEILKIEIENYKKFEFKGGKGNVGENYGTVNN